MEVRIYVNLYSLSGIESAWVSTAIVYPQNVLYNCFYICLMKYIAKNISVEKTESGKRDKIQCEVCSK